jgi:hypothetical protein
MDPQSWPREPQNESSIFTSCAREEVLAVMKMHRSAQRVRSQE